MTREVNQDEAIGILRDLKILPIEKNATIITSGNMNTVCRTYHINRR